MLAELIDVHTYNKDYTTCTYFSPSIRICMTVFNEYFDTGRMPHLTSKVQCLKIFLIKISTMQHAYMDEYT